MKIKKETVYIVISIIIGIALPVMTLEIVLRMLPVYSFLHTQAVTSDHPVFKFEPNRNIIWSKRWNFVNVTRGHVNNAGFLNNQDYDGSSASPLLAIIGDSYIEALMVPHEETVQGRLAKVVGSRGRIYNFAASGAPLSQYLAWAEHAHRTYRPRGLVISIVDNDYDESLMRYKSTPGFSYYEGTPGNLELKLVPYRPSLLGRIARRSALMRYLLHHLRAHLLITRLRKTIGQSYIYLKEANALAPGSAQAREREIWSRAAVDAFLRDLSAKSGLPPDHIIIMVDAMRGVIYQPETRQKMAQSYIGKMRRYLMTKAGEAGFEVIDLQGPMKEHYAQTGERMEATMDAHWSGVGHGVAAAQIRKSKLFARVFPTLRQEPSRP